MNIRRWLSRRGLPIVATLTLATAGAVVPSSPAAAVPSCNVSVTTPLGNTALVSASAFVSCFGAVASTSVSVTLYQNGLPVASGGGGISAFAYTSPCVVGSYYATAQATVWYFISDGGGFSTIPGMSSGAWITCTNPPPTVNNPGNQRSLDSAWASLQMTAVNGVAPYTWSASNLPPGLSINPSTGLISGNTPARTGVWNVTVTVTSAGNGGSGSTTFSWAIRHDACPHC